MDYSKQKRFFETAYNTGSDLWTNKNYQSEILKYLEMIPNDSIILDLGTGRGKLDFVMVHLGFRVIGIDYISELADINNSEVKAKNLQGKIKFVEGDVFDLQFSDESFDAIADFVFAQHLHPEDWENYRREINRVIKPGGYIISVCLSKETEIFFDFKPKESMNSDFEKYGVFYHFFTPKDINTLYGENYKIIKQENFYLKKERENFLITLLQKN